MENITQEQLKKTSAVLGQESPKDIYFMLNEGHIKNIYMQNKCWPKPKGEKNNGNQTATNQRRKTTSD